MTFALPWPPSNNTYYRHVGAKVLLSAAGRAYRADVATALTLMGKDRPPSLLPQHRVTLTIWAHPPDKRRRDLDNMLKAVLDALTYAGVYPDDSQIDALTIKRGEVFPGGRLLVGVIARYEDGQK